MTMEHIPKMKIWFRNPPEVPSPITIERLVEGHWYRREVVPQDFISSTEALYILKITLRHLYRLVESKKLHPRYRRKYQTGPASRRMSFRLADVERLARERGVFPGQEVRIEKEGSW